ncbi:MAG: 2OG-Fe(II) oxygenase [Alphaproteobacteria bacterium]|nr:2OG-Fe(II) oxygenase [Alphaproteobacteria bacterium]
MSDHPQRRLSIGDRLPPYLGFTDKGSLYTSEDQTGRTVVLILAKNMGSAELTPLLAAFSAHVDAFAALGADVAALIGDTAENVFEFSMAHPGRVPLVGSLNHFNFPEHVSFDSETPVVFVADRNMRLAGRFDSGEPEQIVGAALAAIKNLPNEPARDVILPAPVLVLPNLIDRDMCRELIALHTTGPTAESSTVILGGDGKTRIKVKPEAKIRQDFLIKRDHPMHSRIMEILRQRCFPEIKRAFQAEMTHTDIFLVACYPGGGGHFSRHRDNRPKAVAFRRFALSINLTVAEEGYEGGFLMLPEFSQNHYRIPTGGGIIFSVALMHEITPVLKGNRYVLVTHLFDAQGEIERRAVEGE